MTMIATEHDALTNETTIRELSAAEIKAINDDLAARAAAKEALESSKVAAKEAVLAKLGLTAEELAAALA